VDLLDRIEKDLRGLRRNGTLDETLRNWQAKHHALRTFVDAAALIGLLRNADAPPRPEKDAVLAAICAEATQGDGTASTLLLWLMIPGLLRVRQRLAGGALDRDDLDAELVAGLWEATSAIQAGTTGVAARLVNRARRRALFAVRRATDWAGRADAMSIDAVDERADVGSIGPSALLSEAVRAGVIRATDVELICATRESIGRVSDKLGVTLAAAQMRRHRARRRLIDWLEDPT
jgi:hypothetical protein